jgi:hypothetical protein
VASARIAELIAEMPPKEHKLVSREQARLERIGDDLEDEIIALARVNIFRGPAGSLDLTSGSVIVTPSRLIVVEQRDVVPRSSATRRSNG